MLHKKIKFFQLKLPSLSKCTQQTTANRALQGK